MAMANWTCVTLFSNSGSELDLASAARTLEDSGLVLETGVRCWRHGRLVDSPITLTRNGFSSIATELAKAAEDCTGVELEFRGDEFLGSISLERDGETTVAIAAHSRMLSRQSPESQDFYWNTVQRAARAANAAYCLVTVDTLDGLEEKFIDIDGERWLAVSDDRWFDYLIEIWIISENGGKEIKFEDSSSPPVQIRWLPQKGAIVN